jgi:micrococcal nuclease
MTRGHTAFVTALWLMVAPALLAAPPQTDELQGKVVRVIDGDTLELLVERKPVRIRLDQIDAPEQGQAHGEQARRQLATLCAGVVATFRAQGQDRYGRTLGQVRCNGREVNEFMVAQGWAWVYRRYAPADSPLLALEGLARELGLGLWADPQPPVAPWAWRQQQRNPISPRSQTTPPRTEPLP